MTETLPEVLTPDDVSLWLGLPLGRVLRLARAGKIPAIVLPDGSFIFERPALRKWLDSLRSQQEGAIHAG
jgi:hypothetical protein